MALLLLMTGIQFIVQNTYNMKVAANSFSLNIAPAFQCSFDKMGLCIMFKCLFVMFTPIFKLVV